MFSPLYLLLRRRLRDAQRVRGRWTLGTFPSWLPLLRLDHVWIGKALQADKVIVPRDPLTRVASDHLPIVADLSLAQPASEPAPEPAPDAELAEPTETSQP